MALSPLKALLGFSTGGLAGLGVSALSQSNSPIGRMAGTYQMGKSLADSFGGGSTTDQKKMQGVQESLRDSFDKAISGQPEESAARALSPQERVAIGAQALDDPALEGHPALAFAAPELLHAHFYGERGNDMLQRYNAKNKVVDLMSNPDEGNA